MSNDFRKDYIYTMAAILEIVNQNEKSDPLFQEKRRVFLGALTDALENFSTQYDKIELGDFAWTLSCFIGSSLEILQKKTLTTEQRRDKSLFMACAIYLAFTQEIEDLLNPTEQ